MIRDKELEKEIKLVRIKGHVHRKLKILCAKLGLTISDCIESLMK